MTPETLLTFALASFLLSLAPGPDNLFVLMQSALHGARSGLLITLGLCTGLVVHTSLVAAGIAGIFLVNALAFTVLKFCGAAYLLYLAVGAWRAGTVVLQTGAPVPQDALALYRRGILMNLSNPKVAIFFLAFLPQFIAPGDLSPTGQLISLSLVFMLMTLAVFVLYALLAGGARRALSAMPQAIRWVQRSFALLFGGLAVELAFSRR